MNTCLGQAFGNAQFFVVGKGDTRLLFTIPQSDVVNLYRVREVQIPGDFVVVVPRAAEPVVAFPRMLAHFKNPRNFKTLLPD